MVIAQEIETTLKKHAPGNAVLAALRKLLANDLYLLTVDANERSICHRFAMYLQEEFPEFNVDCEYNRDEINPKCLAPLDLHPNSEDTNAKTVFPDVIVHIRGKKQNHLIMEFKKSSNKGSHTDLLKLQGYKRNKSLGYAYALFVELAVGKNPGVAKVEWVNI
jgi:hypothetical protein